MEPPPTGRPPEKPDHTGHLRPRRLGLAAVAALTIGLPALQPVGAEAACNLIPGTIAAYEGAQGSLTRSFAAPGEPVEVSLRGCDGSPGLGADAATAGAAAAGAHIGRSVETPAAGTRGSELLRLMADDLVGQVKRAQSARRHRACGEASSQPRRTKQWHQDRKQRLPHRPMAAGWSAGRQGPSAGQAQ